MHIYPYKNGSQGAKALADALGIKQIKREGSRYKGNKDKLVINWGCTHMSENVSSSVVVNKPEAVALASNKLSFFTRISDKNRENIDNYVNIPDWATDRRTVEYWLEDGHSAVARTVLNGHSGEGIVMIEPGDEIIDAPLYVLYVPKKQEYRVHVFMGKVVDVQRKVRTKDVPDEKVNWKIRNHHTGFVYSRNEALGDVPSHVKGNALNAIKACGLDFGAVDVIYNEARHLSYVLEINTAPGLSGETIEIYRKNMSELIINDGSPWWSGV